MTQPIDDAINTLLSDIDPRKRLRALQRLRHAADKRALNAIAQAAQTDMDERVRQLAQEIWQAHQAFRSEPWSCDYCGAGNDGGDVCASCEAMRAAPANAKEKQKRPVALPDGLFLLYPNSLDFIKGRARHPFPILNSCTLGCATLFLIPFFLTGLAIIPISVYQWYEWHLLENGATTTAYIIDKRTGTDSDGDVSYYVRYRFAYAEREYQSEESVGADLYNQVEKGGSSVVIFAPQDPTISRLGASASLYLPIFLTSFAVCWNVFFGLMIYGGLRQVRQLTRLSKWGDVVTGEIVDCQGHKDSDGDFQLSVTYAFTSPQTGQRITKKEKHQRNDLAKVRLPSRGTPALVLYMNDKLFRLL